MASPAWAEQKGGFLAEDLGLEFHGLGVALTGLGPFFAKHSQGDALGFHRTPRWGWEGVVRSWRLPVGLEARHTDGPFSKFTRRAMT